MRHFKKNIYILAIFFIASLLCSSCSISENKTKNQKKQRIAQHYSLWSPKFWATTSHIKTNRQGTKNNKQLLQKISVKKNDDDQLKSSKIIDGDKNFQEIGKASWYGNRFHGRITANGEKYSASSMTAAHPTLPLSSMIKVTNLSNNKSVIVKVNDRGPFSKNRIIDVSEKAAEELGFKQAGTTEVKIELLNE